MANVDFTGNVQQGIFAGNRANEKTSGDSSGLNTFVNAATSAIQALKPQEIDRAGEYRNELLDIDEMVQNGNISVEQARIQVKDLDRKYRNVVEGSEIRGIKAEYGYDVVASYELEERAKMQADKANKEYQSYLDTASSMGMSVANDGVDAMAQAGKQMQDSWKAANELLSPIDFLQGDDNARLASIRNASTQAAFGMIQEIRARFNQTGMFTPQDKQALYENVYEVARAIPATKGMSAKEYQIFVKGVVDNATAGLLDETEYHEKSSKYQRNVIEASATQKWYSTIQNMPAEQRNFFLNYVGAGGDMSVLSEIMLGDTEGSNMINAITKSIIKEGTTKLPGEVEGRKPFGQLNYTTLSSIITNPGSDEQYRLTVGRAMLENSDAVAGEDPDSISGTINNMSIDQASKQIHNAASQFSTIITGIKNSGDDHTRRGLREIAKAQMNTAVAFRGSSSAPVNTRIISAPEGFVLEKQPSVFDIFVRRTPQASPDTSGILDTFSATNPIESIVKAGRGLIRSVADDISVRRTPQASPDTSGILDTFSATNPIESIVKAGRGLIRSAADDISVRRAFNRAVRVFDYSLKEGPFNDVLKRYNDRIKQIEYLAQGEISSEDIRNAAIKSLTANGLTVIDPSGKVIAAPLPQETIQERNLENVLVSNIKDFESSNDPIGFESVTISPLDNKTKLIGHGSKVQTEKQFINKLKPVTNLTDEELKEAYKDPSFKITEKEADALLRNELKEHTKVAKNFAGSSKWNTLPESIKMALVDTSYEAGLKPENYPRLKEALKSEIPNYSEILYETILLKGTSKRRQMAKLQAAVDEWLPTTVPAYNFILEKINKIKE